MRRALLALLLLAGAVPTATAVAAILGIGVLRGLSGLHVASAAALVTLLPVAGLWTLLGRSTGALAASLLTWPSLLLLGLPGFFPGDLPGAVGTGFAVFASPAGLDAARRAADLGESVAAVAPGPRGATPPPEAARVGPDCPPAAPALTGDQVALPYEGTGHSMAIPVQFGEVELPMLFDTGASVTTLSRAGLRRIGVEVPRETPEITLRTANGERTAKLVLVPSVWVGGLLVEGVTVGICEECADERTAGLLGLNVSSQFLVTVDTRRKEVVFQAREEEGERLIDISPWLEISARATLWPDGRIDVAVSGDNRAPRVVREAQARITCGEDSFNAVLRDIPARGEASTQVSLPRGTDCERYRVSLESARW
jgi:clan AA aspartic protease (TIGR02281 family)